MKKLIVTLLIMFLSCGAWSQIVSTAEMREMYRTPNEKEELGKADDYDNSSYLKENGKIKYRNARKTKYGIYRRSLAIGLRTKQYPDAVHYWSLAKIRRSESKVNTIVTETQYLVLDSIAGVQQVQDINTTSKKIKNYGKILYAGDINTELFLLMEAEYRWGCFLSPGAALVQINNGIIENHKVSLAQGFDDMGELWMIYSVMDGRWPDHMNRALEKMADIVNKSDVDYSSCPQHGNHTIILTYDADTVSAAEMLDGSQNNELLNRLNKALQDVPRKPFPYLYTLDGRRLAGIIVEAVFADGKWAFSLKE